MMLSKVIQLRTCTVRALHAGSATASIPEFPDRTLLTLEVYMMLSKVTQLLIKGLVLCVPSVTSNSWHRSHCDCAMAEGDLPGMYIIATRSLSFLYT